jgi:hypothetical protein
MINMFIWQQKTLDRIKELPNDELLMEWCDLSAGDGEDGYMSEKGSWELKQLQDELFKRLVEIGFLKQDSI